MGSDPSGMIRRHLRTLFDAGVTTGLTDGQLLERFATRRGEAAERAFAALVERHGPMVLRACRGIIRDDHEAMDAFQATFFILARRGGSLWVRDSLGPWLHRVACRAATRARAGAARRRALELQLAEREGGRTHVVDRDDLAAVLHEELDRLPDRYRVPIVLCDLEGRTCEEAARHLGCPIGTIGSRLVRGRERLRDRLRRRGLSANAGGLATSWRPDGLNALMMIPPALVDSTTAAVIRFVAARTVAGGPAALLAQGVLNSMTMIRWIKAASVALALGATTSGVTLLAQKGPSRVEPGPQVDARDARPDDMLVSVVKPGNLVAERGSLESSANAEVISEVEGQTTLMTLLPEGTRVTKGQLVGELDSSALKDGVVDQMIVVQQAEASHENARLTREVAESAVKEYREGIYKQGLENALGEIALAEAARKRADDRLERTRRARERLKGMLAQRGSGTPADIVTELDMDDRLEATEQELMRQRLSLEQAQTRSMVLKNLTYSKTIKQLANEVKKALFHEKARKAAWELEMSKVMKLERQIEKCKLLAPRDGIVVYANDPSRFGRGNAPQVEEGATVRERQKIFSLPDITQMRVNTKVHESIVDRIVPGLRARIKVDAFPEESLTGVVKTVAPLPDPPSLSGSGPKVYSVLVEVDKVISGLRPGMTAAVDILVKQLDNVLSVPNHAVLLFDDKTHVAVKRADGSFEWRTVTLGVTNDRIVEVRKGLEGGESVALDPLALLSEEERREKKVGTPTEPAARPPSQKRSRMGRGPAEESRPPR